MQFRDRIKAFRRVPASQIKKNPKNWREHPLHQKKALKAILEEVGFAGAVLVRETPAGELELIDGHARQDLAGDQPVPVLVLDVNEAEADKILATFDPIGALASTSTEKLDALLAEIGSDNDDLADFLDQLKTEVEELKELEWQPGEPGGLEQGETPSGPNPAAQPAGSSSEDVQYPQGNTGGDGEAQPAGSLPDDTDGKPVDTGIYQYNPNAIFSSRNAWDIPDLKPNLMAGLEHVPTETWVHPKDPSDPKKTLFLWGTNKFPEGKTAGGVIGFYVDDARFETIWTDPVAALETIQRNQFGAAIMPDFSLDWDWPLAMQVWQVYRARWVARFWQEAGIKIIPNISFGNDRTLPWINSGIPKNSPLVSVQVRTTRGKDTEGNRRFLLDRISRAVDEIKPQGVLLYGGTQHREWLTPFVEQSGETQFFFVDSWTLARDRLRFNRKD